VSSPAFVYLLALATIGTGLVLGVMSYLNSRSALGKGKSSALEPRAHASTGEATRHSTHTG